MVPPNNTELTNHPSSFSERIGVIPSGEEWQECETNLPFLTSPKVKNTWSYNSSFPYTSLRGA